MKYLLIEHSGDDSEDRKDKDIYIKYFDDLTDIYSYICHELIYEDLDIEDFKNDPYSGVEERIEEHGSSYYIFEDEKEIMSLQIGSIEDGDWNKFTDFCLN